MALSPQQYEIIASRRVSTDALLWQSPFLSLTAQSFLFTIALGPGTSGAARWVAAFLAFIASLACMQLMSKNRHFEKADSILLEDYGKAHDLELVHARRPKSEAWYHMSSYRVWICTLAVFALAAVVVMLGVELGWGWLAVTAG